ncbi:hypothetical protein [Streptomyces niphimycinicus]|uniref:hypothetical protein n=1 Tax=Streptomyces niphimycinicus TaxID=2842201 RepID=UPI0035573E12
MMNLDLLAFASGQTGDGKYLDIAVEHARTTQRNFPRPDGSTPHVHDFDPASGAPLGPGTVQGYSPASCWSRGQAWGIYGFTTIYRRTGHREFLTTARKLADFALGALSPDHVPVWDYLAPQAPHDIKDASAGAVMACGLLDLSRATGEPRYREEALKLLTALSETCLTRESTSADAVVARCTRNRPGITPTGLAAVRSMGHTAHSFARPSDARGADGRVRRDLPPQPRGCGRVLAGRGGGDRLDPAADPGPGRLPCAACAVVSRR